MPRKPRIQYPDAWYHVVNRGADHQDTYRVDEDRRRFLALLGEAHRRFDLETHGYCLMSNHYHLLLRTPAGNLAEAMQFVDGLYTRWFNDSHGRDGSLFRGRYASTLVDTDEQLLATIRYIHRNPVRAGLTDRCQAYPWSSDRWYRGSGRGPGWVRRDVVMALIGGDRSRYARFVDEPIPADDSLTSLPLLDEIDVVVAQLFGVTVSSLCRSRKGQRNPARQAALLLGHRLASAPHGLLAARYGFAGIRGVESAIRRFELRDDPLLHQQVEQAERMVRRLAERGEKVG